MEMFEGKKGPRIYKRKRDAEFIAKRRDKIEKDQPVVLEVRVSSEEKAQKIGASVHPDLSIAAREPEKGESGWIVVRTSDEAKEKYGQSFEVLSMESVG